MVLPERRQWRRLLGWMLVVAGLLGLFSRALADLQSPAANRGGSLSSSSSSWQALGSNAAGSTAWQYTVIVDAGSSGSRVYLYRWLPPVAPAVIPRIEQMRGSDGLHLVLKVEPGLSSFAGSAMAAVDSLRPLLEFAMQHIPAQQLHSTPVCGWMVWSTVWMGGVCSRMGVTVAHIGPVPLILQLLVLATAGLRIIPDKDAEVWMSGRGHRSVMCGHAAR